MENVLWRGKRQEATCRVCSTPRAQHLIEFTQQGSAAKPIHVRVKFAISTPEKAAGCRQSGIVSRLTSCICFSTLTFIRLVT
jgi:hypothetical protein